MADSVLFNNYSFENGDNGVFNRSVQRLIKKYQEIFAPPHRKEVSPLHVDEIASKLAYFYERIRKIIDWKEENLLRRNAIERILKRTLISEISRLNLVFKIQPKEIAEPLVLELIRGGHLPNDKIPADKVVETQEVLEKYIYFLKNASFNQADLVFPLKERVNFYEWVLEIAACEIEEILSPPLKENALIETMTALMAERIKVIPEDRISKEEQIIQIYIACHRTLFDLDDPLIAYHLLKYRYPQWKANSATEIQELNENIFKIREGIKNDLNYPLSREFFSVCERIDTVFLILGDILGSLEKQPAKIPEIMANKDNLKELITHFYNHRYKTLKARLFKLGIFSTLSVFVSNWFTFFIVEVPLARLFYERFNFLAALVDFIVPSLAMFALVAMIKPPPLSNLQQVIQTTFKFVYQDEEKEVYEIKLKKKRRTITGLIIFILYLLATFISFGAVALVFYISKIPMTSVILDTMLIAVNVFAALAIRNKSREITVEEKTSFWEFLIDILSIPVAQVGSWFAKKWKEYNIISIFFNVIIETPFVTLIEFVENWRNFLKEKKAEFH